MATSGSDSSWLKALGRRREQTHNDKSTHTSRLNVFYWGKRKTLPRLYNEVALHDPQSEIRLLDVLPGTEEIIKCSLRSVPLANTGNYEGLSYHWSGDVLENRVYVNEIQVPVHGNLYDALRFLRYTDKPRVLWVDAICIDQERDDEHSEKRHQLLLMRQIYGQAERTVAYIGREANRTHLLDRFVKHLLNSVEQLRLTEPWAASLGTSAHYLDACMRKKYSIPDDDYIGWKTLADLVSRSWVERQWVVQEAAVARDVVIQCGPYSFAFDEIASAYLLMWTLNVPEVTTISTHFKSIVVERAKQKSSEQRPLLSLVIRHWLSECKYKQDKIYALRGLACDVGPGLHDNTFDYDKSVDTVYTEFARDAIRISRNLDILSALAPFDSKRSAALPSWVPDWRVFGNGTFLYRRPDPPPDPGPCTILFTASKSTFADPIFSADARRVQLHGHILDTIVAAGAPRPYSRTNHEAVSHFLRWRNGIARCLSEETYPPTQEPMIEAFYHTLTMANLSAFLAADALPEYRAFDTMLLAAHVDDRMPARIEASVVTSASRPCVNRRLVRTERGYLGLVHGMARKGDQIALLKGGLCPVVIREKRRGEWAVVGDGYVHGVMKGEAFDEAKCEAFWFV